jgi:prophage antirepressor-like protein
MHKFVLKWQITGLSTLHVQGLTEAERNSKRWRLPNERRVARREAVQ